MGNISNFNKNKIDLRLSNVDYYDFYLANGDIMYDSNSYQDVKDSSLVVKYDFNNNGIFTSGTTSANTIYSLVTWDDAINTGYTLDTIGLTGIDNGLITFDKTSGDTTNQALLSALTGTTLVITSGDTRLCLNRITGSTGDYVYPMEYVVTSANTGNYMDFCGGFYQGYYKIDGTTYEVLPNRVPKAWVADFWLKKSDECLSGVTGTTLNDLNPNNKGIFYYMGTRAENKFWNQFEGLNTGSTSGCTSGATEWCTIPKESDINVIDDESDTAFPLNPPLITIEEISNQFLLYGRGGSNQRCLSSSGNTDGGIGTKLASTFTGTSIFVTSTDQVQVDFRNPFLIYSRANSNPRCHSSSGSSGTGELASTYSGDSVDVTELDWKVDVVDNAIAFMIKDDGSVGYRLLTVSGMCSGDTYVSGCSIEESFSVSGMVKDNEWTNLLIRFVLDEEYDECQLKTRGPRRGKLMFYVNAKLKHVAEIDEIIARRLGIDYEHWKKQVAVPFNISLGGGSQGLLESMTFDGQDPDDMVLCIQENFAGTFIGSISKFNFYISDLNWCDIKVNFNECCQQYGICPTC